MQTHPVPKHGTTAAAMDAASGEAFPRFAAGLVFAAVAGAGEEGFLRFDLPAGEDMANNPLPEKQSLLHSSHVSP